MSMAPPMPAALIMLLLMLPGVFRLGLNLSRRSFSSPSVAMLMAPGIATCLWLVAVHALGLVTQSFVLAVTLGTLIPGSAGYLLRQPIEPTSKNLPTCPPWYSGAFPFTLVIATLIILPAVVFWDFHDKIGNYSSHFSVTAQILNNIYPPRDLAFADHPLHYHYGVDTLFAMVGALARLPVDWAIDAVTIFSWIYTLLLLGALGYACFGRSGVLPMLLVGAFGGGWPWIVQSRQELSHFLLGVAHLHGHYINPPTASYFFQHPWTLGLPLTLMVLLIMLNLRTSQPKLMHGFLLALCFTTLGLSNITLCLSVGAALLGATLVQLLMKKIPARQALLTMGFLFAGLVGVFVLSGMTGLLSGDPALSGGRVVLASQGIGGNLMNTLQWNLATFGFLLPFGFLGLFSRHPLCWVLFFMAVGGIVIVNTLEYTQSWDIVKFATVAQLALSLGAAGYLVSLKDRPYGKYVRVPLLGLLMASGLLFHLAFWINPPNIPFSPALWKTDIERTLDSSDKEAIQWLRGQIRPGEIVLVPREQALAYAYWGGFPQLWTDPVTQTLGYSPSLLEHRATLTHGLSRKKGESLKPYWDAGVRWIVLKASPSGTTTNIPPFFQELIESEAFPKIRFGPITIYRLRPPSEDPLS